MTDHDDGIAFTVPPFTAEAKAAALRVLDSGWVTTGPESSRSRTSSATFLGQPYVVTPRLVHPGARAEPAGAAAARRARAVLTPSLTFCGAVAAIVHAGYRPVLVDIDEPTRWSRAPARRWPRRLGGRRASARWSSATSAATRSTTSRSRTPPCCRTRASSSTPRTVPGGTIGRAVGRHRAVRDLPELLRDEEPADRRRRRGRDVRRGVRRRGCGRRACTA